MSLEEWTEVENEDREPVISVIYMKRSTPTLDKHVHVETPAKYIDDYFRRPMERPWMAHLQDYIPRCPRQNTYHHMAVNPSGRDQGCNMHQLEETTIERLYSVI